MTESLEIFHTRLREYFGDKLLDSGIVTNQLFLDILPNSLISVCEILRNEEEFSFEQLSDVCGVDYLSYGQVEWETNDTSSSGFSRGVTQEIPGQAETERPARFAVVYHLLSLKHNRRLRLRCYLPGDVPRVNSVTDIWASANWYEREVFDLFGIMFDGHPDLRRILTDYGFIGNPFRKDFPLVGNVEVRYDPDKKRVVYQPVTIKNRVLVPKVIRQDNRFVDDVQQESK